MSAASHIFRSPPDAVHRSERAIFWVFHVIRDYAATLREGGSRMTGALPGFLDVARRLEAAQVPLPIVFGHHDLLPANILDDGRRLWLIDWEYGAFGTAMFEQEATANGWAQPTVYAHEELPKHFDRYLKTLGWNRAINMRQFAIYLPQFSWPDRYRYPDVTYQDAMWW